MKQLKVISLLQAKHELKAIYKMCVWYDPSKITSEKVISSIKVTPKLLRSMTLVSIERASFIL